MALTGTKLIHMRSAVAAAIPTAQQLGDGQIAINTADKLIFIKDSLGNVVAVASAAAVAAALSAVQTVNTKTGPNVTLLPADIGANGVAPLDVNGKIQLVNLPDAVLGGVNYQGTYNAATNVPALPTAATANKGFYWVVTTAGTQQGLDLTVGDWVISNGTAYEKVDAQDAVSSVNDKTGAVTLVATDVGALPAVAGVVSVATSFENPVAVPEATADGEATNLGQVNALIAAIPASGGTVTSVAVTVPSIFTATGSPITEAGTIAISLATQAANLVFAGPGTGADAAPTFRALVAADVPALDEGTYA